MVTTQALAQGQRELQQELKALKLDMQEVLAALKTMAATQATKEDMADFKECQPAKQETEALKQDLAKECQARKQDVQGVLAETEALKQELQVAKEGLRTFAETLAAKEVKAALKDVVTETHALKQDLLTSKQGWQEAVEDLEATKKELQQLKDSQAEELEKVKAAMQGMMQAVQDRATQQELQKAFTEVQATKKELHELKEASKQDLQKVVAETQALKEGSKQLREEPKEVHLQEEERKRRNWKLFVKDPIVGKGFRSSGNDFLIEEGDYAQKEIGAVSFHQDGVIEATLEEPVHVNAVTIAPFKEWSSGHVAIRAWSIEVKSPETGLFETLRAEIPNRAKEETFQVGRVISALRLRGHCVGISKLIFS